MNIDMAVMELLCAHLCHEIISPVTAINNGLELLEDSDDQMMVDAVNLVKKSASQAARRLVLLRLAYGAGGKNGSASYEQVKTWVQDYFEGSKITLDWAIDSFPEMLSPRAVALSVLLGEEALIYGGMLRLSADENTLVLTAEGRAAGLREEAQKALVQEMPVSELSSRTVHAYITACFSQIGGWTLYTEKPDENRWVLKIKFA